jgi:hypothetical protein
MPLGTVSEQQILEALHRLPVERWPEVLHILERMAPAPSAAGALPPIRTGADLLHSGLIGIWADRTDITDNREFARQLRQQASHRRLRGKSDAAGQ